MYELNIDDAEVVSGGNAFVIGIGVAAGYAAIIDYAMDFGAGLGIGIYDATH